MQDTELFFLGLAGIRPGVFIFIGALIAVRSSAARATRSERTDVGASWCGWGF